VLIAGSRSWNKDAVPVCYREWRWLGRTLITVNCIFKSSSLLISAFLNFDLFFTSELLGRWRNSLYVCWLLVYWDLVIVVCVCFICYILIAYSWIWRLFMHVVRAPDKKISCDAEVQMKKKCLRPYLTGCTKASHSYPMVWAPEHSYLRYMSLTGAHTVEYERMHALMPYHQEVIPHPQELIPHIGLSTWWTCVHHFWARSTMKTSTLRRQVLKKALVSYSSFRWWSNEHCNLVAINGIKYRSYWTTTSLRLQRIIK